MPGANCTSRCDFFCISPLAAPARSARRLMESRTVTGTQRADATTFDAFLFERLPDPYIVVNIHLQVEGANAACRALLGISHVAFGSQQVDQIDALAEQGDMIAALVEETHAGRVRRVPVFRLKRSVHAEPDRSGASRYRQIRRSLLPVTDTSPPLVALRFDDVTLRILDVKRERRERAQMRSHARLKTLLAQEAHERIDEHLSQSRTCWNSPGSARGNLMWRQARLRAASDAAPISPSPTRRPVPSKDCLGTTPSELPRAGEPCRLTCRSSLSSG
ncbi:protein of unknown function (plasmid) [Pararobbsia alpina]